MATITQKTQNYKLVLKETSEPDNIINYYISEISKGIEIHCQGFRQMTIMDESQNGISHYGFQSFEQVKAELLENTEFEFVSEEIKSSFEETLDNYLTSETAESKGETNEIDKSNQKSE